MFKKVAIAAVAAAMLASSAAQADDFPTRAITIVCPWGAGGGSDAQVRFIAGLMEKELGQPVKVENKTGGGGAVGWSFIAKAKADGYTLGQLTAELAMDHWITPAVKVSYKDFDPLALMNEDPAGITVSATAPYKTYDEFVKYLKDNPGKVRGAATSVGGIWHVAMGKWLETIGLPVNAITYIPTSGSAESYKEMAAGGVDACFPSLAESATMYQTGKAVGLAVMSDKRDPKYPDIPTAKELGADVQVGTWRGIGLPKGVPADRKEKLMTALRNACKDPSYLKFMEERGFGIKYLEGDDFYKYMEKSDADLGGALKALGLAK
ncbi:MAG TPA: tripartite tricarboxylate transporter substrate-binding protein [Succinivibrionaceae bacterium]|nr:tripartite tricarboxylate transporter substrate-binding protein [Succinivibrionaceae bacterium]